MRCLSDWEFSQHQTAGIVKFGVCPCDKNCQGEELVYYGLITCKKPLTTTYYTHPMMFVFS